MSKMKAMALLLMVVLVHQPFSSAALRQDNTGKSRQQSERRDTLSESQIQDPIYITLVNPLPDSPINFSKKEFKQELQHKLALQVRFSLAIQLLAWLIGLLTMVAGLRFRRRMSELDHRKCVP